VSLRGRDGGNATQHADTLSTPESFLIMRIIAADEQLADERVSVHLDEISNGPGHGFEGALTAKRQARWKARAQARQARPLPLRRRSQPIERAATSKAGSSTDRSH
jgi:hypothetical protein